MALATALGALGNVTFRWSGEPPSGLQTKGQLAPRLLDRRNRWRLVAATEAEAVARLFEAGWASGDQDALIGATNERALHILSLRDLRDVTLQDEELLFSSVVDGMGARLAAAGAQRLATTIDIIA